MRVQLTGRTRYGVLSRLLSPDLVVLEVEETISGVQRWSNDGGRVECETLPASVRWRNATIYDLQALGLYGEDK